MNSKRAFESKYHKDGVASVLEHSACEEILHSKQWIEEPKCVALHYDYQNRCLSIETDFMIIQTVAIITDNLVFVLHHRKPSAKDIHESYFFFADTLCNN